MTPRGFVVALAVVSGLVSACDGTDNGPASATTSSSPPTASTTISPGEPAIPAPDTFFALRDVATELVEVEVATGQVRRTLVDYGPYVEERSDNVFIQYLDVAPDRRTLYFSTGYRPLSVFRLALPDGQPERIADGGGPSISPDGDRLAFMQGTVLHVRDQRTGEERTFPDLVGELGGGATAWAPDGRHLAFEQEAADSVSTDVLDTATGKVMPLQPRGGDADSYRAFSPSFRTSDGLLAVVCCSVPEVIVGQPQPEPVIVLHDPVTGEERERLTPPSGVVAADYDASGTHLLVLSGVDGPVYRFRAGGFEPVPSVDDVWGIAW